MKRKIVFLITLVMLLSIFTMNASTAFAGEYFLGREITNLPDRIALTDEPITISELQYLDDGETETELLRYFELTRPTNNKVIEVVPHYTENYFGENEIDSITITPKGVGSADICLKNVFDYYKTIQVYDPNMAPAERDMPRNLEVKKNTPSKLDISWDPVYGATKYMVYRSKTGKDGTFKKIKTISKTSCTDTGLTPGKTYYYKVKAVTEDGTSNASDIKKCRVSYKLKLSIDIRNKAGASTGLIRVAITNKGTGTFKVKQDIERIGGREFIETANYYPYRKAIYSKATLINGDHYAITSLSVKKGKTRTAMFALDSSRIPQKDQSILFQASYDGVDYFIVAYDDGSIFYRYHNSDTLYQLK